VKELGEVKFLGIVTKSDEISGTQIFPEYCEGTYRLEEFSHAMIFYWFHLRDDRADMATLRVVPKRHLGAPEVGVFASRSPSRPNPIGFCVVEVIGVDGCKILVKDLDAVEGSTIIDIKPYIPGADAFPNARAPEWTMADPPT